MSLWRIVSVVADGMMISTDTIIDRDECALFAEQCG